MGMESWGEYTARNRDTGSVITLADNRDGLHDDDPAAKWMTVCDTHSTYVTSATRSAAYAAFVTPWDWCEDCRKVHDKPKCKARRFPCEGSGRRVAPTGSSAFPEVRCPCCCFWASPVKKYGDYQIRSHQPVASDDD